MDTTGLCGAARATLGVVCGVAAGTPQHTRAFAPVVAVTLVWLALYYAFCWGQSFAKVYVYAHHASGGEKTMAEVKYGAPTGGLCLWADRTFGNLHEQSLPFLAALWLNAVFVGADNAALYGKLWLGARAFYPILFPLSWPTKRWPLLWLSTFPGYACVFVLAWQVGVAVLGGLNE